MSKLIAFTKFYFHFYNQFKCIYSLELGNNGILYNREREQIKWSYLVNLVKFRGEKNFHSVHKLTEAHINYASNPMKVILALQTLSHCTADALEFLRRRKYPQFVDAGPTIIFIRHCAEIFSVLNTTKSSKDNTNPLKNMMSESNEKEIFECFDRVEHYMKGILNILSIC